MIKYMNNHKGWIAFTKYIIQVTCTFHCIYEYIGELANCTGPSMEPTIISKDVLLMQSIKLIKVDEIKKGDIVVARSPVRPGKNICKRVIGLPGDKIPHKGFYSVQIPTGHVWLEGDNSANSTDSRTYGPVPQGLIRGKALCRIYPFSRFTLFTHENKFS